MFFLLHSNAQDNLPRDVLTAAEFQRFFGVRDGFFFGITRRGTAGQFGEDRGIAAGLRILLDYQANLHIGNDSDDLRARLEGLCKSPSSGQLKGNEQPDKLKHIGHSL